MHGGHLHQSILEEASTEIRKVNPETRIRPLRGSLQISREPIEPSIQSRPILPTVSVESFGQSVGATVNVSGALESIKRFHRSLFGEPVSVDADDDSSGVEPHEIEGPLIKIA